MNLDSKIEAILFIKGEPVKIRHLAKLLEASEKDIKEALTALENNLTGRGLQIIALDDEVTLGTKSELGPFIAQMQKEEVSKELSRPALETLATILYAHPEGATRAQIDWIRGVNSSFILRNLAMRGLVSRMIHPTDKRTFIYKLTTDLLSYLGVGRIEDLPDFAAIREKIAGAAEFATSVANSASAELEKSEGLNEESI
jgi:segregation and condensation protein B